MSTDTIRSSELRHLYVRGVDNTITWTTLHSKVSVLLLTPVTKETCYVIFAKLHKHYTITAAQQMSGNILCFKV
jgi:hypothetical protein